MTIQGRAGPARPSSRQLLAAGVVGSLLALWFALALARYLQGPGWIDALWGAAGSLGLATALGLGLALQTRCPDTWGCWAALVLAVAAAGGRLALLQTLRAAAPAAPLIAWPRIALGGASVAWAVVALLWGTQGVAHQLEGVAASERRWPALIAAGLALVLALHSAAPLWRLLGLEINHWTVLGLFGLAATAYALELGYRRLRGSQEGG